MAVGLCTVGAPTAAIAGPCALPSAVPVPTVLRVRHALLSTRTGRTAQDAQARQRFNRDLLAVLDGRADAAANAPVVRRERDALVASGCLDATGLPASLSPAPLVLRRPNGTAWTVRRD